MYKPPYVPMSKHKDMWSESLARDRGVLHGSWFYSSDWSFLSQIEPISSLSYVCKERVEYEPLLSCAQTSLDNLAYSGVELGKPTLRSRNGYGV